MTLEQFLPRLLAMLHVEIVVIAVLFAMSVKGLWDKLGWWEEILVFVAVLFAMSLSLIYDMASETLISWPVRIFNAFAHGGFSVWVWHWGGKQIAAKWSAKQAASDIKLPSLVLLFFMLILVPLVPVAEEEQEIIPRLSDQELQDRASQERISVDEYKHLYIESVILKRTEQVLFEAREMKEAIKDEGEKVKEAKEVVKKAEEKIGESLEQLEEKTQEIKALQKTAEEMLKKETR